MTGYMGRANRGVTNDILNQFAQDERLDMAVRLPARVKSVADDGQSVTLEVMYRPRFAGQEVKFPDLPNVPVEQARGGGFSVSVPVGVGDYGMVSFAGRDISRYHETGEAEPAPTARMNSYSDGTFTPGAFPKSKPMSGFDRQNAFFGTEDHANGFRVTPDGTVAIEGAGESLLQIVSEFLDLLAGDQAVVESGSSAGNWDLKNQPQYAALKARLDAMKYR